MTPKSGFAKNVCANMYTLVMIMHTCNKKFVIDFLKRMFFFSWFSNFSFTYLNNQLSLRGHSVFKTSGRNPSFQ